MEESIQNHPRRRQLINRWRFWAIAFAALFGCFIAVQSARAASLYLSPSSGTFTVGSTFTTSIFLNTEDQTINTIGATINFPSDKLQLVSPTTGNSIISLWTAPPTVDNRVGRVTLLGGVPGGIQVNNGLVMTLTFRVKSVGSALLKFADDSKVLLHDGQGTDALKQLSNGVYVLALPPPAGPIVVSETHPDQSQWYANSTVFLRWSDTEAADGFSYVLDDEPISIPDDIAEGKRTGVTYKNTGDGQRYFHIKALKEGAWGGTTHYAVRIDATPPAQFPVELIPAPRTTRRQPIAQFATTDALSGIDHYEVKLIPLRLQEQGSAATKVLFANPLFVEAQSPHLFPELELGTYEIVVRAYDKAQNYREVTSRLAIVSSLFKFIDSKGLEIRNIILIPWPWLWALSSSLILLLLVIAWLTRRWHRRIHAQHTGGNLPSDVEQQLKELKKYRSRYGAIAVLALFLLSSLLLSPSSAREELPPPVVESVSRRIANDEIFYVGGKTASPDITVLVYLQNLQTGETQSNTAISDKQGVWFYRHEGFLSVGKYLLWTQSKIADEYSPPGPQIQMEVAKTAFQIGASRLSYGAVYAGVSFLLFLVICALLVFIFIHYYHGRRKLKQFMREVREAEEAVRRGFAVLRRDIKAELAIIHQAKLNKALSAEEAVREKQLLSDLDAMERYVGKEVWDMEKYAHIQ